MRFGVYRVRVGVRVRVRVRVERAGPAVVVGEDDDAAAVVRAEGRVLVVAWLGVELGVG